MQDYVNRRENSSTPQSCSGGLGVAGNVWALKREITQAFTMKNQYFADINDYRKYGLLRCLTLGTSVGLGICWMLTPSDDRRDGQFVKYWEQPQLWRKHDPDLFDKLSRCKADLSLRDVVHVDTWGILPGAVYYCAIVPDSANGRRAYISEAWGILAGCDLIFFGLLGGLGSDHAMSPQLHRFRSIRRFFQS
jgi:hypothetical protein